MGLTPSFIYFKTFQIVHIAIGLTQELTMYVIQSYAGENDGKFTITYRK